MEMNGMVKNVSSIGNYNLDEDSNDYRQDMEAASKARKPLQEMIKAG